MIVYILKSTVLLGLLWGLYKLFLENEKMHRFNRAYLLIALVVSFTAPLITFDIQPNTEVAGINIDAIEQTVNTPARAVSRTIEPILSPLPSTEITRSATEESAGFSLTLKQVLIGLYILISALLLIRFMMGLFQIRRTIKKAEIIDYKTAQIILVDQKITPQSFLQFIFINKHDYESGSISSEILEHELTHVRQFHSFDILLIEFLKVFFWFNPFLYGFKHSIMLNHEFLADQHVVSQVSDRSKYHDLLLQFSSSENAPVLQHRFSQANTKRRILMLSRKVNSFKSSLKTLIVLFVALIIIPACSNFDQSEEANIHHLTSELVAQIDYKKTDITEPEKSALDSLKSAIIRMDSRLNMKTDSTERSDRLRYKLVLSKLNSEFNDKMVAYIESALSGNPPSLQDLEYEYAGLWGSYSFISALQNHLTEDPFIQFSSSNFPKLVPSPQELLKQRTVESVKGE
jgi:beta-lactamase regulating signal transducer with metallopeptidase domain